MKIDTVQSNSDQSQSRCFLFCLVSIYHMTVAQHNIVPVPIPVPISVMYGMYVYRSSECHGRIDMTITEHMIGPNFNLSRLLRQAI